jgi:phosphoribosylaminoimidazole-succinocarboxamide synthase
MEMTLFFRLCPLDVELMICRIYRRETVSKQCLTRMDRAWEAELSEKSNPAINRRSLRTKDVLAATGITHQILYRYMTLGLIREAKVTATGQRIYAYFNELLDAREANPTDDILTHFITAEVGLYPAAVQKYADQLRGRSMVVARGDMFPVECVVRGYLSGSGWKEYQSSGKVCGIQLPAGLKESDKLPEPIFTPSTKAASGHDENISLSEMVKHIGAADSENLRRLSLSVYQKAADYALTRGIIIADTKFEFGRTANGVVLADEVLTPDSSRFWPADRYEPGRSQASYDKQYVRDYLEEIHWDKKPPAPALPETVQANTSAKYIEAFRRLTGRELPAD